MADFDCNTCASTSRKMVAACHLSLHEQGVIVAHKVAVNVVDAITELCQKETKAAAEKPEKVE